ncbi:MAG TPA: hypothetical protein VMR90_14740 [Candidatus Cybelea sp.]|nr:hypothetical protein [Candidatus Cybelea sp.]
MNKIPPPVVLALFFAIALGVPFGLYALLTRGRRRMMREIRQGAEARGWLYGLRRWQGDPTAFRIQGRTNSGLSWTMASRGTKGYDKGWTVMLGLSVPMLGGVVDLAVLPRDAGHGPAVLRGAIPEGAKARLMAFSGTIGSAVELFQNAQELPSGLSAFDTRYEVLVLPKRFAQPLVDAVLAQRLLTWPADSIAAHSVLAWRDPLGFHVQARLPGPANWGSVTYLASLAEEWCARVPAPEKPQGPPTMFDRAVSWVLRLQQRHL